MKSLVGSDAAANGEGEIGSPELWANFESQSAAAGNINPHIRSLKEESDFDDWQEFKAPDETPECCQFGTLSSQVLNSCFQTTSEDDCISCLDDRCIFLYRLLERRDTSVTCPVILSCLRSLIASPSEEGSVRLQLRLDLPADCNDFDWDSESGARRDSISPILFRPGQPESPVGLHFDHERASLGLSALSQSELNVMCQEMERKFSRLSESLVVDLQLRDKLVFEMTVKNKFISAMLRVQSLKQSSLVSGGSDGGARTRSKSLRTKLIQSSEERINGKYLSSIIPYCLPEDSNWSLSTLLSIIDILNAIAEDSDNVSTLVAEYLQNEGPHQGQRSLETPHIMQWW